MMVNDISFVNGEQYLLLIVLILFALFLRKGN